MYYKMQHRVNWSKHWSFHTTAAHQGPPAPQKRYDFGKQQLHDKLRAWKLQCFEGRLSILLPPHPKPAHFHEELYLDFPEWLPPIQKPVLSRNSKVALLPVLHTLLGHAVKSSDSEIPSTSLQMVISEHFWAKFHQQNTIALKQKRTDKHPNTNWKHLLKRLH